MKFNSPPTDTLCDVEYYMDEPEKTKDSGLFNFRMGKINETVRVFLEEGQFTDGNRIFFTVIINGID